jgi:hypothetical protein
MRTKIAAAIFLLVGGGAGAVGALDNINMLGSDTIGLMTKDVINNCSGATGINYLGTGSGNGESRMATTAAGTATPPNAQTASPMSRFLKGSTNALTCAVNSGTTASGLAVALDGIALVANGTSAAAACGGIAFSKALPVAGAACPGCVGGTYTAADAFDFIRVAWYGIHHNDPTGATPDCNSDVRKTMLGNYANIFQTACPGGTTACPTGVRHLWRRDDASGTTDTFNTLVGGGAATGKFCNVNGGLTTGNGQVLGGTAKYGFDFQDNDPIRVTCSGNGLTTGEQVCGDAAQGHAHTLGTLLTIFIPDSKDVPAANTYPTSICSPGVVAALPATRSTYSGLCPAGNQSFGGKCFSSMFRNPDGSLNANCIQAIGTGRCPTLTPAGADCRGANLWLRNPDGSLAVDTSFTASLTAAPTTPPNGAVGRFFLGAFYKIHTTTREPNGTGVCTAPSSSTEQIGCLSSVADPCTIGFAGRSAADVAPAVALNVGGVVNDVPHIQNLVTLGAYPASPTTYPLARKLYFTSMIGFGATGVSGQEAALARCYADDAFMDSAAGTPAHIITANGFVVMPAGAGGRRARCEDFDEVASGCTGAGATNSNACAANVAPLPTN